MAVGVSSFPATIDDKTKLIRGANAVASTVGAGGVTNVATTIPITSTTGAPADGIARLATYDAGTGAMTAFEVVSYTGKTGTSLTGCTRGFEGTASAWSAGTEVVFDVITQEKFDVLQDAIIAIQAELAVTNGALAARALTDRGGQVFNVKAWGAIGDGVADDTTEINDCIAAANAAGAAGYRPTVLLPMGTYKVTGQLTAPVSGVTIAGEGPSTIIAPAMATSVWAPIGTTTTTALLAANGVEGDKTITLAAGSVAALSIAVGSRLTINDPGASYRLQQTYVTSVAGEVVGLSDPLYEPFPTANGSRVQRLTPLTNLTFRDFTIDGAALTGTNYGIIPSYLDYSHFENLHLINFLESGIYLNWGYGNVVRDIFTTRSGSLNNADLTFYGQTAMTLNGVVSVRSTGFGPLMAYCNGCNVANVHSTGANQRSFKLQTSSHNHFVNISVEGGFTTGLSITIKSRRNHFTNVEVVSCGEDGIWFAGDDDSYNTIINAYSQGNVEYELEYNSTDVGNLVIGDCGDPVTNYRNLGGVTNTYIQTNTTQGVAVYGKFELDHFDGSSVNVERLRSDDTGLFMFSPKIAAGSATADSWPEIAAGTLLTTPEAGAWEFDGVAWYQTVDATNGRAHDLMQHHYRLTADSSALASATIADYFPSPSSLPTVAGAAYEIIYYLWFTKTTAGTVVYTITSTTAPTRQKIDYVMTPVGGVGTVGTPQTAGVKGTTSTALATPASGSLTTAVDHRAIVRVLYTANTAGNVRLRITPSAGTVTPLADSFYVARRLPGNTGIFVA